MAKCVSPFEKWGRRRCRFRLSWHHSVMICFYTFPVRNLNFYWRWLDWIQAIFLNLFYFNMYLSNLLFDQTANFLGESDETSSFFRLFCAQIHVFRCLTMIHNMYSYVKKPISIDLAMDSGWYYKFHPETKSFFS